MTESFVDGVKVIINLQLDLQLSTLDTLEKWGPTMIRAWVPLYIGMVPVPPWARNVIADFYIERLMDAIAFARKVNKVQRELAKYLGSPDALRGAAKGLDDAITGKAKDYAILEVRSESLAALDVDTVWSGPGADKYRKSFDNQSEAFARISEYSASIADALRQLAKNIEDFYLGVAGAVASLYAIVIGLAVALTGVGAIPGVIVAILGVIGVIISLVTLANTNTDSTRDMLRDLDDNIAPWPPATFATP